MGYKVFVHRKGDHVGVAVEDLQAGERVGVVYLDDDSTGELAVQEAVPLGHKVALVDLAPGQVVVEYGEAIGKATAAVRSGQHVHVHNLRSLRWSLEHA